MPLTRIRSRCDKNGSDFRVCKFSSLVSPVGGPPCAVRPAAHEARVLGVSGKVFPCLASVLTLGSTDMGEGRRGEENGTPPPLHPFPSPNAV